MTVPFSYRMDMVPEEEIARQDPFQGNGLFLPFHGTADGALAAVQRIIGEIPAVAWPWKGAWVDPPSAGLSPDDVRRAWDKALSLECDDG